MQSINGSFNYDMATATKSIREFSGNENEDVNLWIKMCRVTANVNNIPDELLLTLMINSLRGMAQEWLAEFCSNENRIDLVTFIEKIQARFPTTANDSKILNRFLEIKSISSREHFRSMASDATAILNRGMINIKSLLEQFIIRCPAEMRMSLYQKSKDAKGWSEFLTEAEAGINLLFPKFIDAQDGMAPENLLNHINSEKSTHSANYSKVFKIASFVAEETTIV